MDDTVQRLRALETDVEHLSVALGSMSRAGPRIILRSVASLLAVARWELEDAQDQVPVFAPGDHE